MLILVWQNSQIGTVEQCLIKWLTFSCKTLAATCSAVCGYWCACASIVLKCDYIEQTESWRKKKNELMSSKNVPVWLQ